MIKAKAQELGVKRGRKPGGADQRVAARVTAVEYNTLSGLGSGDITAGVREALRRACPWLVSEAPVQVMVTGPTGNYRQVEFLSIRSGLNGRAFWVSVIGGMTGTALTFKGGLEPLLAASFPEGTRLVVDCALMGELVYEGAA